MEVTLPNGIVVTDVPENATQEEVKQRAIAGGLATLEDFDPNKEIPTPAVVAEAQAEQRPQDRTIMEMMQPYLESAMQGAAAVPVMAGVGRGLMGLSKVAQVGKGAQAGPKIVPELARGMMPQSGRALAAEGVLGAASGVAAQAAGEQVPEGPLRDVVSTAAGAVTAVPFALGKNALTAWGARKSGGELATMAGKEKGLAHARTVIESNPNVVSDIQRAGEIEAQTGINLPVLAASNGDTTISGYLASQMADSENAKFTAQIRQQYEAAEEQLTKLRNGLAPSMEEVDALVKQRAAEMASANKKIMEESSQRLAKRQAAISRLDDNIAETTARIDASGKTDIGARLSNLIKAKAATIRKELSPAYEALLKEGQKAGIKLSGDNAKALATFARSEQGKDVFQKFPELYSAITRVFRPETVVSTKFASKYPQLSKAGKTQGVYRDVSLTDLDSLKRAVNKAIRDSNDPDQLRMLGKLKGEIDSSIGTLDSAFSTPYKALDAEYAVRLGIPFSEEGVAQISRARFVENTVPTLTKNSSSLKQVLAVAGDEGEALARDAFMLDIMNNRSIINVNTGQVNPAQLRAYMQKNKESLNLIPNVKKELEGIATDAQKYITARGKLQDKIKADTDEYMSDILGESFDKAGGLRGTVKQALSTPSKMDDLLSRIEKDPVAQKAVQGSFLDDLATTGVERRLEVFDNNIPNIAKIFGGAQVPQLRAMVEASVRLEKYPFYYRPNIKESGKTGFEQVTGTKPSTSLGELRNQVISAHRAFINHVSRFFQNNAGKVEKEAVQAFLLDKKALELAAQMQSEFDAKGASAKFVDLGKQLFKNSSTTWLQGGLVGLMTGELNDTPYEPYTPSEEAYQMSQE